MSKTINDYATAASVDAAADYFLIQQASSGAYKRVNRNAIFGVSGTPADISTVQSLTNKTLDNTNTLTLRDDRFTLQDDGDTTKQARFQLSGITTATTRTYTLPNVSDTLVALTASQTLTNKTLTSPTISGGSISNTTVAVDAVAEFTAANGVTVDGLNIKDGALNTNNSVVTNSITDSAVTPAKLQSGTGASWTLQTWSPTWTNVTVGNGVVVAKYIQIGKTVYGYLSFTLGTTSAISGDVQFTLPVTANASYSVDHPIGPARLVDAGVAGYPTVTYMVSTTKGRLPIANVGGTYPTDTVISSTVPFTWGTADFFTSSFWYEVA